MTIVTANRRLARFLRQEHDARQRAGGVAVWPTPEVLPWPAWLEALWDARLYSGANRSCLVRLGAEQERLLWERVIRASPEEEGLLSPAATADAARKAWTLLQAWRLDPGAVEAAAGDDTRAFLNWKSAFEQRCEAEGWLDEARLPDCLAESLDSLPLPERVLLAGFDEFTPQQEDFLAACRRAGAAIHVVGAGPEAAGSAVRTGFPDHKQEIAAAARWARALLERGDAGVIGVVVRDLESIRDTVERVFTEALHPAAILPGSTGGASAFNISAGLALSSYPVVRAALAALELNERGNAMGTVSALLRSPFLAGAESERAPRALLDARLRERGNADVPAALVRRSAAESGCPDLGKALGRWLHARKALPRTQGAGAWSRSFSKLLGALGWPGERSPSSEEYQAIEAWNELLSEFARLDCVGAEFGHGEAHIRLARMASESMFQPEGPSAPVQVLGMLEASGLRFDHLWIAGLDDESWPRPASPAAFLPVALQRARHLPHASPERELEFARLLTSRLLASAPDVVVSYPLRDGDEELGPSPLIRGISECSAPPALPPGYVEMLRASARIESFEDRLAPAVAEGAWQYGGAKVFQYQAACPFRAFAELRLRAAALESPAAGLGARHRGTIVHAALENLWRALGSHARLVACTAEELQCLVRAAAADALARLADRRGQELPPRFGALEQARLERLVSGWLEVERARPPFTVVEPERGRHVELGGIRARVQLDRIDRLEDGSEAIIDYKTAEPKLKDWEGERPSQPQLPLYAVTHDTRLGAVLFAQVRTGNLRFKGVTSDAARVPGAAAGDLDGQLGEWRRVLKGLAAGFLAGHAEVDPKEPAACRTCTLAPLCRSADAEFATSAMTGEAQ